MSSELEATKVNRFRFLKLLYEKSGGDQFKWFNLSEIGRELELGADEAHRIMQYLNGESLAEYHSIGGDVGITHQGVKEIEQAISNPRAATGHFPPAINIIEVHGDVVGAQIQQATQASQQMMVSSDLQRELSGFLSELEKGISALALDGSKQRDLVADIDTMKAQLKASQPKRSIVREALSSIRSILEGAGATLLAAEAAKLLGLLA